MRAVRIAMIATLMLIPVSAAEQGGRVGQRGRPPSPVLKAPASGPYDIKGLGLGSDKTLVVVFAAERCPDCRTAIPFYRKLMALPRMDGKVRRLVIVAMDGLWPVKEILDPAKLEPHRLTSGPYPGQKLPDVTKAPTVLLLDRAGKTIGKWEGALSAAQQEEIVQAVSKSTSGRGEQP